MVLGPLGNHDDHFGTDVHSPGVRERGRTVVSVSRADSETRRVASTTRVMNQYNQTKGFKIGIRACRVFLIQLPTTPLPCFATFPLLPFSCLPGSP